jgi:uncharacterized protein
MDVASSPCLLDTALAKEERLLAWLARQPAVLIGFSGGVDSTYLACLAVSALGADRVLAVIGRSASYPAEQWATARAVADRFGLPVHELDTAEMSDPEYVANPTNRCYFCKRELWSKLTALAVAREIPLILDGTNADDLREWRPGMKAAEERHVRSPLAEVGLSKEEIRILSRERGIPIWAQPSSPCLSSRLPYGTAVTTERLQEVERAERALRELGITGDLRVRHHGALARVELAPQELSRWLAPEGRRSMAAAVRAAGFVRVAIDLRGFRSGSLNVLHGVTAA